MLGLIRTLAKLTLLVLVSSCGVPAAYSDSRGFDTPLYAKVIEAAFEARDRVHDPHLLRWANLDQGELALSCVDGRTNDAILGSPGGDAGELMLLLAAVEAEGHRVDTESTPALIDAWIAELGGFYMHTDTHALAVLGRSLAIDPRFGTELGSFHDHAGQLDLARLEAWLRAPPIELHEPLLAHLVDPDAVGCGHISSILRAPADYTIRPALAGAVIVEFYRHLWRSPGSIRFVVLHGEHHEHAILDLEVDVEHDRSHGHEVPMLSPSNPHDQMFVIQPQAVAVVRLRAARVLGPRYPGLAPERIAARMDALGHQQLAATIAHLHVHVPTIRVVLDHEATRSIDALDHDHSN